MAKLCECGCGKPTQIAKQTDPRWGHVAGRPVRFIRGHHARVSHPNWNGGRTTMGGYSFLLRPEHPRASSSGYVREHVFIAETALGKPLPEGAQVHHVDEDKSNNANRNLVVCQDQAYHRLLHRRRAALLACGNPGWFRCRHCGKWDAPENLYVYREGVYSQHRECQAEYERNRQTGARNAHLDLAEPGR